MRGTLFLPPGPLLLTTCWTNRPCGWVRPGRPIRAEFSRTIDPQSEIGACTRSGLAVLQSSFLQCLSLDGLASPQDGFTSPEVDVCGREIRQAFVIPPMVVVLDERCDLRLESTGQIVMLQQDAVYHRSLSKFYRRL